MLPLSKFSDKRFISIDWDARSLRVVGAKIAGRGRIKLGKIISVPLPADAASAGGRAMGLLIRRLLTQERINVKNVIIDVPRDQAILNTLVLPTAGTNELANMVQFQIAKELPFPVEEAVVDFAVNASEDQAESRNVLVAAVRHEVLDYYREVCDAAGLALKRIGLRPLANTIAVNEFLGGAAEGRVLHVDVGPALTEIDVICDGMLVFSRAASVRVPENLTTELTESHILEIEQESSSALESEGGGTDLKRVVNSLLVEVVRSTEAYRANDASFTVSRVVVSGSSGIEEPLAEAISRRFKVPCVLYNPSSTFKWDSERGSDAMAFSAALGLALGHSTEGRLQFNFLDPKKPIDVERERRKKIPVAAIVALLFIAAVAVAWHKTVSPIRDDIASLDAQIAEVKDRLEVINRFETQVNAAKQWQAEEVVWLDEIHRIVKELPEAKQAYLTELAMHQKDGRIDLKMRTSGNLDSAKFADRLNKLKLKDEKEEHFAVQPGKIVPTRDAEYQYGSEMKIQLKKIAEAPKSGRRR